MPIIFVHGVANRKDTNHKRNWEKIEASLKKYVAPVLLNPSDADKITILEAFWGDLSVPLRSGKRVSMLDDKRVINLIKQKKSWIERKIREFNELPNSERTKFLRELVPEARKKLIDLPGYLLGRLADPLRKPLNEGVTLFIGDVFFYLAKRGTAEKPGKITEQLLDTLTEAHKIKMRTGEPLIVFSHSMGGQLVYDMVSYYLPQMSQMPEYEKYKDICIKDICIDFWCATASQVGLFKEMQVFKQDDDGSSTEDKQEFLELDLGRKFWDDQDYYKKPINKVDFPSQHLKIWWNLWDDSDYLSFTVEPFVKEVFDDLYDSGKPPTHSHSGYFDDPDFYREFALLIQEAKDVGWDRLMFLEKVLNSST
jgi:hypothetical protein